MQCVEGAQSLRPLVQASAQTLVSRTHRDPSSSVSTLSRTIRVSKNANINYGHSNGAGSNVDRRRLHEKTEKQADMSLSRACARVRLAIRKASKLGNIMYCKSARPQLWNGGSKFTVKTPCRLPGLTPSLVPSQGQLCGVRRVGGGPRMPGRYSWVHTYFCKNGSARSLFNRMEVVVELTTLISLSLTT